MQRTKASMFSSLAGCIEGAVFADLYAGAGAVGIEALSRGASFVHFVECDRIALDALRENLAHCGIDRGRFRVHGAAVAGVLDARPCPLADAAVVFADPPYDVDAGDEWVSRVAVDALPRLQWLVVEHRTRAAIVAPAGLTMERARRFGETMLTYFSRD
jgi:16S rRNA (guanine966-N2)-methyltransferase